jgi:TRAP-type mannitol/chloroaromatic compound transport system permease small subunit
MAYENKNGFVDSLTDALSFTNLLKKFIFMVVVISMLSIRELIEYLNLWGDRQISFLSAILSAYRDGMSVVFSSTWTFISNFVLFKFDLGLGDLIFGILFFLGAFYVLYQPVSLVINIFDMKKGHASPIVIRIFATIIFVIIISATIYFTGGESAIGSSIAINETIANSTIEVPMNLTNSTGGVPIITLT